MPTKMIPLSEPMGNDSSCCKLDYLCKPLQNVEAKSGGHYKFRCPLMVEVDEDVEFGECGVKPECPCATNR